MQTLQLRFSPSLNPNSKHTMSYVCKAVGEVLKRELTKKLLKNELITGYITHKNEEFMTVSIGYKTDARINSDAIWNYSKYQANSEIQVHIEQIESNVNETILSRRVLDAEEAWKLLIKAKLENLTVEGAIIAKVSEGYVVKVLGLLALLPLNLIDERARALPLIGSKAELSVFQLNKLDNFIKLKLTQPEEKVEVRQALQTDEYTWGIIKEVLENGLIVDLCSQDGRLLLQDVPWHNVSDLMLEAELGQVVESRTIGAHGEDAQLSLQSELATKIEDQQLPILGVIARIMRYWVIIQTEEDTFGIACFDDNDDDTAQYLANQNLELGDVVKTLPIEIDYDNKQMLVDIDTESARYNKYVTLNRENTVMGIPIQASSNTVVVFLGDDIYGTIEMDTPEQAAAAYMALRNQNVEFDVIDYDASLNIINLQTVVDERTTALLAEA
ncbi:MAG: hypothetical protein AAI946_00110 [Candidatus Hodgkinia cicadicola]